MINAALYCNKRLLYNASHVPRFPSHLGKSMLWHATEGRTKRIAAYDPFVGSGTILCNAQLMFHDAVDFLFGSDVKTNAVETTEKNLTILTEKVALDERMEMLRQQGRLDTKTHINAIGLQSYLRAPVAVAPIRRALVVGNALDLVYPAAESERVVVTDPPYGRDCQWMGKGGRMSDGNCLRDFVTNIADQDIRSIVLAFDRNQDVRADLETAFHVHHMQRYQCRVLYIGEKR